MGTIRKVIEIDAPAEAVWDVIRDVGAVHTRLAPGFVVDTQLESDGRVVEFANGLSARELIVGMDPQLKRLAYAVVGGSARHHNASFEVIPSGPDRSQLVWTSDFLPDTAASALQPMIDAGSVVIQRTLSTPRG
jgi:ligand-binding SRPBCC domain-containing protein